MSQDETSTYLKKHFISLANLVVLLGIAFRGGYLISQQESKIETNKIEILKHISDKESHMPFEKKIEVFVPRVELDSRMLNMEKSLARIEDKLSN